MEWKCNLSSQSTKSEKSHSIYIQKWRNGRAQTKERQRNELIEEVNLIKKVNLNKNYIHTTNPQQFATWGNNEHNFGVVFWESKWHYTGRASKPQLWMTGKKKIAGIIKLSVCTSKRQPAGLIICYYKKKVMYFKRQTGRKNEYQ